MAYSDGVQRWQSYSDGVVVEHQLRMQEVRGSNPGAGQFPTGLKKKKIRVMMELCKKAWGAASLATTASNALPHQSRIGHPGVVLGHYLPHEYTN